MRPSRIGMVLLAALLGGCSVPNPEYFVLRAYEPQEPTPRLARLRTRCTPPFWETPSHHWNGPESIVNALGILAIDGKPFQYDNRLMGDSDEGKRMGCLRVLELPAGPHRVDLFSFTFPYGSFKSIRRGYTSLDLTLEAGHTYEVRLQVVETGHLAKAQVVDLADPNSVLSISPFFVNRDHSGDCEGSACPGIRYTY